MRVVWYDNDTGCKGACANIEYHDMTALNLPAYCTDGECLDDILLQDIEQPLAGAQDTVIILHTIGSHGPTYYQRYTPEYRAYTPTCDTKQNPAMQPRSNHQHLRQHHPLRGRLH